MIHTDEKKLKDWMEDISVNIQIFVHMAITLTNMVYKVHKHNAVSGALNPSNIRILPDATVAKIAEITELNDAYRAPEQTGRINRIPDGRSDLYALGVIFYEMLTGQMPFMPQGDEDWSYVHLTARPIPLNEVRPEFEGPIQAIIMKLMAKSPEDRYQSAYGLLSDLKHCEMMLNHGEILFPFKMGRLDEVTTFRIPDTLFGRVMELAQLEAGLEAVISGKTDSRWITGCAGVGKTALVQRFKLSVAGRGAPFVEGKCKPLPQITPFEPILQPLREWIEQLWSEPTFTITSVKNRLATALGHEAYIIASLLPEAGALLDIPTDDVPLPSKEVEIRFGELIPSLIGCFVDSKQPLVMFIDDLEWADERTLAVLHKLLYEKVPGLMLIGSSRTGMDHSPDNGEREQGKKSVWLNRIFVQADHIALKPLLYDDVRQFLSSLLHEDTARIRLLAKSIYCKTSGNPRSLCLLLESWESERKLIYDENQQRWTWDAEVISQISEPVGSDGLIITGLNRLSEENKRLLAIAAAIGPCFHSSLLAEVSGYSLGDTLRLLDSAELEGLIYYEDEAGDDGLSEGLYMFVHDQVRQTVYKIYAGCHAEWHLKIGQLQQRSNLNWHNDALFETLDHLNLGIAKMTEEEKRVLAEYNLQAGLKARVSMQIIEAKHYYETGLYLAEAKEMESCSLLFQLMLGLAGCEYMSRNIELSKALLLKLKKQHNLNQADRLHLNILLIRVYTTNENDMAVQFGREALSELGWMLPEKASRSTVVMEILKTQIVIHRIGKKLYQIPPNDDADYNALSGLIIELILPLLQHNTELLIVALARFIRYGLNKGLNDFLVCIIGVYELLLQRGLPKLFQASLNTKLAYLQSTMHSNSGIQYQIPYIIGLSKQLETPGEAADYFEKTLRRGVELGDTTFSILGMITCIITHNGDVHSLSKLLAYIEGEPRRHADDKTLEIVKIAKEYRDALQDETLQDRFIAIPTLLSHDQEQEEDNYSYGCKLEVAYLSGKYREALHWASRGRENELDQDWVRVRKHRMYETLSLAALYPEEHPDERKRILGMLRKQLRLTEKRRGFLGANSSAHLLIKAEWARISRNEKVALQGYMAAVKKAREEKHGLIEAISCERLSIYYQEVGSQAGATISMMDARTAYSAWGVNAKVSQIRNKHSDLLWYTSKQLEDRLLEAKIEVQDKVVQRQIQVEEGTKRVTDKEILHTIVKWQGKPEEASIMEQFLATTLRQVSAERGFIFRYQGESFHVETQIGSPLHHEEEEASVFYSEGVLRYVLMTGKPVVLDDASRSYYKKDPYIQNSALRSIICMPIVFPIGESPFLLYLENTHLAGVFTEVSVDVLELMITRMTYLKILEDSSADNRENVRAAVKTDMQTQALIEPLTNREVEILNALSEGLSNREIAESFGITEHTVKTHVSNIYSKLGVKRRGQAIVRAKELQLIRM